VNSFKDSLRIGRKNKTQNSKEKLKPNNKILFGLIQNNQKKYKNLMVF